MPDPTPTTGDITPDQVIEALHFAREIQDVLTHVLIRTRITALAAAQTALQGTSGADQAAAMLRTLATDLDKLSAYANGTDAFSDGSPTVEALTTSTGGKAISYPLWPAARGGEAR